jgi:predicted nuclease of predicted toxin-antitoxin system
MPWKPLPPLTKNEERRLFAEYPKKARFLVDENLDGDFTLALRDLGWNAKGVSEVGLRRRADEDVTAYAWRVGRIIVTNDADFLDRRRFPFHRNPGVVILPQEPVESRPFARAASFMLSLVGPFGELWRQHNIVIGRDGEVTVTSHGPSGIKATRYRFTRGPCPEIWA